MMKCITFPKELGRCTFRDIDPSQFVWVHDLRDFAGYNRTADGAKGYIAFDALRDCIGSVFFSEVGDGAE